MFFLYEQDVKIIFFFAFVFGSEEQKCLIVLENLQNYSQIVDP